MKHRKSTVLVTLILLLTSCGSRQLPGSTPSKDTATVQETSHIVHTGHVLKIDSAMKRKVTLAFDMLRDYADRSIVLPSETAQGTILCYNRVVFGVAIFKDGGVTIEVEEDVQPNDLVIFFEDTLLTKSDHVAQSLPLQREHAGIICIVNDFVKKSSVQMVGGVLFHELNHHLLAARNELQQPGDILKNERIAYARHLFFLVFAYEGKDKEYLCFSSKEPIRNVVPRTDSLDFVFYFNKLQELNRLVGPQ